MSWWKDMMMWDLLLHFRELAKTLVLSSGPEPTPSHQAIQHLQDEEDDPYFGSYSHFSIHHEMLQVCKFYTDRSIALWGDLMQGSVYCVGLPLRTLEKTHHLHRDVIMSQICETPCVGSLWPTVVYIRINNIYVVLETLWLVSCVSHYSPVASLNDIWQKWI